MQSGVACHWNVKDIQSEIHAMEMLLQARPTLGDGQVKNTLLDKVTHLHLQGPADLVALYEMVENSKLPESLKGSLLSILDRKAGNSHFGHTSGKVTLVPQQCEHLNNYFTEGEHKQLMSCDMWKGASVVSNRLRLLQSFAGMKAKGLNPCHHHRQHTAFPSTSWQHFNLLPQSSLRM